jgi:zinc protease
MKHELKQLSNRLNTLFIDSPGSPCACVQIWFRAGSAMEKPEDYGIAHFLEHMFFKGTQKRPGAQIAHDVESFGGEVNAFTSFDYTCYYINAPNKHLSETIDILLNMVAEPMFNNDDIVPERDVVFEEFLRTMDSSSQYSFLKIQETAFSGGYVHPILGTEENIKSFSQTQLKDFRKKFYNRENALLVIAGDLKKKSLIETQIETFKLPSGPESKTPRFGLKKKPALEVHQKDVRMAQMTLTIDAPGFNDISAPSEDLALNCLGHGESSRLYQKLVLKDSLANSSTTTTMFMGDGGVHFLRLSAPYENFEQLCQEFFEVINEFIQTGVDNKELKRIKNQHVASKVYDMESLESYAFSLGHGYAQTGDENSEENFVARIKSTTKNEVNQSISDIFQRPIHISFQVPKSRPLKEAKTLAKNFSKSLKALSASQEKKAEANLPDNYLNIKEDPQLVAYEIQKGVKLLYRYNPLNPTFVLHTYIKGGLTEETDTNNGIHHLLSSLLTKGHKKANYEKLKAELEDLTASFFGFAGKNAYGLNLHGQSEHFKILASHFFESLLSPKLENRFLKHEKELTFRTLENLEEDPIRICFQHINELFFNQHPYRRNILGSPKALKKLKKVDLSRLHQNNLKEKEMLITYCGDLPLNEVLESITPYTNELPARSRKKLRPKKIMPLTGQEVHVPFDREQTHIFHGIPAGKLNSTENIVLKMLTTYLSGQSSPLFVEVRDRQGLCYTAQPVHFNALEGGYWGVYMATSAEKVDSAITAIKKIIDDSFNKGLKKSHFNRIKKMIEGQSLINVQTNDDYANVYSVPYLQGLGLDFYHRNNQHIKELKYDEFKETLAKLYKKKWSSVIVGREEM